VRSDHHGHGHGKKGHDSHDDHHDSHAKVASAPSDHSGTELEKALKTGHPKATAAEAAVVLDSQKESKPKKNKNASDH